MSGSQRESTFQLSVADRFPICDIAPPKQEFVMHTPQAVLRIAALMVFTALLPQWLLAETHFVEAESFVPSSSGWKVVTTPEVQRASRVKTIWGADGPGDAVATKTVTIQQDGKFRVWVRSIQVGAWRGPFRVSVSASSREIAAKVFDLEVLPGVVDWNFAWQSFEAELPVGDVTLTLAKHEQKNCVGYVRHVDCLLLTTDFDLKPNHLPFGPQTFVRVTLGDGYQRPVYFHLFADHYRDPWYSHHAIGKAGLRDELAPPGDEMLKDGERSPWCNISHIVYQDSGVALSCSVRHSYHEKAGRLRAKLEFGRPKVGQAFQPGPNGDRTATSKQVSLERLTYGDIEIIKTFDVEALPNGLVVIVPPDLDSPENIAILRRDRDFAEETGRLADAFPWPKIGKRPTRIPFLVSENIGGYELPVDAAVTAREQKTLDNFGFNGGHSRTLGGLWMMKNDSYCRPDIDGMRERIKHDIEAFRKSGRKLDDIAYCMLMDEPTGQAASFMARDEGYRDRFREWLKGLGLAPKDLLEPDWEAVRPVVETEREQHPALHYFTQRFRTVALGDFMSAQKQIIEAAYGIAVLAPRGSGEPEGVSPRTSSLGSPVQGLTPSGSPIADGRPSIPFLVNFSDGAVYHANFCSQGVDYFELLNRDDSNAIWGEDWANNSSTYQCAAFNVDLMRAAARKRGQTIGHYLIAYGRSPWDNKLKATGETARGVRQWMNFSYGPSWGSHEGGPAWKSSLWYSKPESWTANAEIPREIGAVEDWLLTSKPAPAEVAILYSSSSDIWTMNNFAFGFDRMHTWLALTHSQTPVDIVPEHEVAEGQLAKYRVCYLSGPNLSRAAAEKLKSWVEAGGSLWLTAGAASRDEFNRPLDTLTALLPVERGELVVHEPYQASGLFLHHLAKRDEVRIGNGAEVSKTVLECLSVKQTLNPKPGVRSEVFAHFQDSSPAALSAAVGRGRVDVLGFLPGLSYIKPALLHRVALTQKAAQVELGKAAWTPEESREAELLKRSLNPWRFPSDIREALVLPVRQTNLTASLTCDTALVDAVALPCEQGVLISLANHTLSPIAQLKLQLQTTRRVTRIESVHRGPIPFEQSADGAIRIALPLEASDWLKVACDESPTK